MYYGLLSISVIMFGLMFFFNKQYEKQSGSSASSAFLFMLIYSLTGAVIMLAINRFRMAYTPFTLIMASAAAVNLVLSSFCSIKALGKINLSMYSILSMLGGMLLPFIFGIIMYKEPFTVGKIICVVLIIAALLLTLAKGEKSRGFIYYIGIFTFNGMSGVLATLFQKSEYAKTSPAVYSVWSAIFVAVIAAVATAILAKHFKKPTPKALMWGAGYGAMNSVGNYLLLLALAVLPSSVQYPFVTGGVMIVSTVISALIGQKPSKRELLSVALAFAGIMVLIFVP